MYVACFDKADRFRCAVSPAAKENYAAFISQIQGENKVNSKDIEFLLEPVEKEPKKIEAATDM